MRRPILLATQDILIADLSIDDRETVDGILKERGVALPLDITPVARWAMACPALPTCGLALNEAGAYPRAADRRDRGALTRHGLPSERLSVRITGCPNGCARPYAGDIGLVGRTPGHLAIYLGGDFEGTRLNRLVFERVRLDLIAATLEPIFAEFAATRHPGESFGDFCHRHDNASLLRLAGIEAKAVA